MDMRPLTLVLFAASLAGAGAAFAQAPDGAALFQSRCSVCHNVPLSKPHGVGPDLQGVVGRKAASTAGYDYSAALKGSGLTWTRANLDKWLAGPTTLVPGTKMVIAVFDPAQRSAIIDYLAKQK